MQFRRSTVEATARSEVRATLNTVRWRWRLRVALRGLAVVVLAGAATLFLAAWAMDQLRFEPWAVNALRIAAYAMVVGLLVFRVLRPLRRALSDERVALYVEEREPASGGRLVTAAELLASGETEGRSPALANRVLEEAAEACDRLDRGRGLERERLARSSGALAGAATLAVAGALLLPGSLRRAAPFLFTPWRSGLESPYAIAVAPGDTAIARGADLLITARSTGFVAEAAEIVARRGAAEEWQRVSMLSADTGGAFQLMFFDVDEQTTYFVEAAGVRSGVFTVTVADLPYVAGISLDYRFPAYTGLEPRHEDDGSDIVGPAGTEVTLTVTPTVPVLEGALVLNGSDTLALALESDGTLSGAVRIDRSGSYRVALRGATGPLVTASPDHVIDVLADGPPLVTVTTPGRDIRVTAIDEVFVGIEAKDDYGVTRAELVYSVNGGADDTVVVHESRRARPAVAGGRTLFLEEFQLEPGDVITYHARAADALGQWAASDIYFLEIQPFDRTYRQGDQAPGGMEGGMGGDVGALSQRQREIVAATFKMVRDSAEYSQAEYRGNLATLALAQGRLREEVESLAERMVSRGLTGLDSTLLQVAEALPRAAAAMKGAEDSLGRRLARGALPPEQQALRELQRAEAAFREWTVTRNEGGGGGGGGGEVNPDELADLFELELDRARNQYEQLERGRREQADRALDETLERVRELARRQQQENERARARAQRGEQATGGGGGGAAQRQLADEAEELARQLERLSREQSRPDLAETARQLRDASEAMRRAAASGDGSAQGARALEQLREARRQLEGSQGAGLRRDAEDALRRAERLAADQRDVQDAVDELPSEPAAAREQARGLLDRKQQMAEEVNSLAGDLDRLARESQRTQPDAAEQLREASRGMRNERLEDMIRYSRGVLGEGNREAARNLEEQIGVQIDSMRQRIADAVGAMGEEKEQRLGRALDDTRDLANSLDAWAERARDAGEQAGDSGSGAGGSGARQQGAEARARRGELERLRREFTREGIDVGALDRVLGGMGRLDNQATGAPRGLAELAAQLAQQLREFEFSVRRDLAGTGAPRFLGGSDEVPPGYRSLVEEYYRSLAERRRRQ